jgi:hypothetical protein
MTISSEAQSRNGTATPGSGDSSGEACRICGRWLRKVTDSHLRGHGLTHAAYRTARPADEARGALPGALRQSPHEALRAGFTRYVLAFLESRVTRRRRVRPRRRPSPLEETLGRLVAEAVDQRLSPAP